MLTTVRNVGSLVRRAAYSMAPVVGIAGSVITRPSQKNQLSISPDRQRGLSGLMGPQAPVSQMESRFPAGLSSTFSRSASTVSVSVPPPPQPLVPLLKKTGFSTSGKIY